MTPEERLAKSRADYVRYGEPARSVMVALDAFHFGLPVTECCTFCGSTIRVWLPNPQNTQAWQTACDCGKSNGVFKGL